MSGSFARASGLHTAPSWTIIEVSSARGQLDKHPWHGVRSSVDSASFSAERSSAMGNGTKKQATEDRIRLVRLSVGEQFRACSIRSKSHGNLAAVTILRSPPA